MIHAKAWDRGGAAAVRRAHVRAYLTLALGAWTTCTMIVMVGGGGLTTVVRCFMVTLVTLPCLLGVLWHWDRADQRRFARLFGRQSPADAPTEREEPRALAADAAQQLRKPPARRAVTAAALVLHRNREEAA